jgi:hypothetical protein
LNSLFFYYAKTIDTNKTSNYSPSNNGEKSLKTTREEAHQTREEAHHTSERMAYVHENAQSWKI